MKSSPFSDSIPSSGSGASTSAAATGKDLEGQQAEDAHLLQLSPRTRAAYMKRTQSTTEVRAAPGRRRRSLPLLTAAACGASLTCVVLHCLQAAQSILHSYVSRRFMGGV